MITKTPTTRLPFFNNGGEWFVDLTFNWGEALTIDAAQLERLVASAGPTAVLIARRMTPAEQETVLCELRDGQVDTYARFIKSEKKRWSVLRRRR